MKNQNDNICVEKIFTNLNDYYHYKRKNIDGFIVMEKQIARIKREYTAEKKYEKYAD